MHGFDRVFNYFFLLGVSPFYIRSPQLIVSRSFSAAAVLKLIFGLAACLFTLYTGREFVFKPSRIDVSFLTMISAISTVAIDFLLLQILLLAKNETQATLLLELRAIERSMDVLLGPVTDHERVFSTLKRTTREIILKSVILFSIPLIPCALFPELAYVLIICSFFIMFYSVLFQFMHNRLFLVYLNQSIDRYMIYIENDANPPLTSQIIVKCVRAFHGSIVTYNRTFRYQNMILAHCAFMVLLLFIYIATILGTKYDFSVSFLFLPGFILMGHDLGRLVWLCSVTASKLEQIKRVHSRQLEVAENATDFTIRLFFLHQMPQFACGNLSIFNNAFLTMMLAAILNYLMILIQFRYNDKKQLAEEQAMYNITTTPLPPLFGLLTKH